MNNHRNAIVLAAIAAAGLLGSATAEEATKPVTITIDNYATIDGDGALLSTHEIDVVLEGKVGAWTVGVEGWGGFEIGYDLEEVTVETPGFLAYLSSDAFGEVQVWDASGALDNACITPTGGSQHFGTDDLLSFGTCGGYGGQTVLYISPDLDGFGVQLSAMRDIVGTSDVGSVDGAVSAALTYAHTTDGGIDISASLAADFATSVNGGLAPDQQLPVTVQAGVNIGWDGWIAGGAAQYELNSLAGGNSWGVGVGLGKAVTEQLVLAAEVSADGYEDAGVSYEELSFGATAEYRIVDEVYVDAAFNVVHLTGDDGTDEVSTQFGTGLSWAF
jgi:hypothetical protein